MYDNTLEHRRDGISNTLILTFEQDSDAENPLTDWDGMWTLYAFDSRSPFPGIYKDRDEFLYVETSNYRTIPNLGFRSKERAGLAFPVRIVDYGCHGFQVTVYDDYLENYDKNYYSHHFNGILVWENSPKDMGAKTHSDRYQDAKETLKTLNAWLAGEVYGFILETEEGEYVDSCFGYYGPDEDLEHFYDDIKQSIESYKRQKGLASVNLTFAGFGTEYMAKGKINL